MLGGVNFLKNIKHCRTLQKFISCIVIRKRRTVKFYRNTLRKKYVISDRCLLSFVPLPTPPPTLPPLHTTALFLKPSLKFVRKEN